MNKPVLAVTYENFGIVLKRRAAADSSKPRRRIQEAMFAEARVVYRKRNPRKRKLPDPVLLSQEIVPELLPKYQPAADLLIAKQKVAVDKWDEWLKQAAPKLRPRRTESRCILSQASENDYRSIGCSAAKYARAIVTADERIYRPLFTELSFVTEELPAEGEASYSFRKFACFVNTDEVGCELIRRTSFDVKEYYRSLLHQSTNVRVYNPWLKDFPESWGMDWYGNDLPKDHKRPGIKVRNSIVASREIALRNERINEDVS